MSKPSLLLVVIAWLVSSGGEASAARVWTLVHGGGAGSRGVAKLQLVDLERGTIVRTLALPAALESPHALAFDGKSLWVGGIGAGIHELDPVDGAVRSVIAGVETEGLAADGRSLWLARHGERPSALLQIDRRGKLLRAVPVSALVVNDIAFDGTALFYVANSDTDPVVRVDLESRTETTVAAPAVIHKAPYTLTYAAGRLIVVDRGRRNVLRVLDPANGAVIDEIALPVCGWITAIAFERPAPQASPSATPATIPSCP